MSGEAIRVAFLDVGQADSSVIIFEDRTNAIVIDCPSTTVTIDYLVQQQVTELSYVCVSHSDEDHIGGTANLVNNFSKQGGKVDNLAFNIDKVKLLAGNRGKAILSEFLKAHERFGVELVEARADKKWNVGNVCIEVLHPTYADLLYAMMHDKANDASIVLRLTYGQKKVLFTGDLQGQGWKWLINRVADLTADVLKFPHHGAWYEPQRGQPSLEEVLRCINPNLAVISVGSANSYGHPDDRTIRLLCSLPNLKFAHTQPTGRCYSDTSTRRGPFSCSGSVEIAIQKDGIEII